MQGRIGILKVHARNKKIEEGLDYHKVARATAGFTGAELMNLMNTSAVVAVRRGAKIITEADVFQVPFHVLSSIALFRAKVAGSCHCIVRNAAYLDANRMTLLFLLLQQLLTQAPPQDGSLHAKCLGMFICGGLFAME